MKIILSRLVKDSQWVSCSKCETEVKFPVIGANYTLRKQAHSWLLGWAKKNKMSPGNIKLPVSTVIPFKWPVSQLFRNFDYIVCVKSVYFSILSLHM